ncbi:hypothetical protein JAAARDRAFT_31067 [Jaapia argillacea MUCL 33604]|uniref:Protein BFR2 n=1 Tax=Jaapia argillacea MUCL 33604 TaxID=933084 RepID=A0A067QG63_9AGAM|nr:hypothetical protein JAAARDRAFT_31067 [Jaapia argillacea MUCL 33604]
MRLSLAQQIAELEETAPIDFDPADAHVVPPENDEEQEPVDNAAAREHYLDVGPSAIRKLHDSVADPKYDGVRISRKQLQFLVEEDDGHEEEEAGDDQTSEDEITEMNGRSLGGDDESEGDVEEDGEKDLPSDSQSGWEDEEDESQHSPAPLPSKASKTKRLSQSPEPTQDISSTLAKTRQQDVKKGKAVSRQLALWDSLLDARIRLQKAVTAANRLPLPHDLAKCTDQQTCQDSLNKFLGEAMLLSDELFDFQESLLVSNETIQPPAHKRRKTGGEPDWASQVQEASQSASTLEAVYHPHFVQTLSKWSSKIQAVAPSVLLPANRNAFSKHSKHQQQHQMKSVVQLVEETLAEREKLVARTRVIRAKGNDRKRIRVEDLDVEMHDADEDAEDPNTFDDADFYQQLLRDLISTRTSSDPSSYQPQPWHLAQKALKSKKKKTVDTRASKGRKLRYEIHEKLQNFMVPVPMPNGRVWHEEQVDELFASLLGKGFEGLGPMGENGNRVGDGDGERERLEAEVEGALSGGFRVFG